MSCVLCKHGETRPGLVTVTLQRGETTVVLKRVPADVCDNCGGYYLFSEVAGQVMDRAEVEIVKFAA